MLKQTWKHLLNAVLMLTMSLAGCANSGADLASEVQGRWHRIGEPTVHDPLGTLAREYIELGLDGVFASLLFDQGRRQFWTAMTGEYAVRGTNELAVHGTCWRSWQSYNCSQTYRFRIRGDRLTIYSHESEDERVEYERVQGAGTELPPRLVPPMPSPTPAGP